LGLVSGLLWHHHSDLQHVNAAPSEIVEVSFRFSVSHHDLHSMNEERQIFLIFNAACEIVEV
jgi:hypothetical protein